MVELLEILQLPLSRLVEQIETEVANNPFLEVCSVERCLESMDEIIDVAVQLIEGGGYKVLMPDDGLSVLSVNQRFVDFYQDPTKKPQTREYLARKIKEARQLMEMVRQRRQILQRIAQVLFQRQPGFLERGPSYLIPVRVQEIADAAGFSGSTVTCALQAKRVQTPHGVFALKDFVIRLPGSSDN
jgi:RNA polymerase sigma-54 factor